LADPGPGNQGAVRRPRREAKRVPRHLRRLAVEREQRRGGRDPRRRGGRAPRRPAVERDTPLADAVRPRRLEAGEEAVLQARTERLAELDRARRVAQHEHRLEAAQVAEEPAAARLHEERVARQLEGAPRLERAGRRERVGHFCREPGAGARGLEDAVDVAIAGAPRVAQDIARARLVDGRQLVAQPVDRLAERRAPGLRSPGLLAYPAAAVGPPALDAVRAAPRGPLGDLDLEGRWMPLAEGGRAGERDPRLAAERAQREGQRHLAEAVVVAVGLAVASDGQDGRRPRLFERGP